LRTNEVRDTDMAWCQEVDAWMPLKEMPPLEGVLGEVEQDTSEEIATKISETETKARAERAQPWLRFLARTIDTWLILQIATVIAVATGIFKPAAVFPAFYDPGDILAMISLAVISSYVWVFIEAWTISKWGTTPGKALFNIRVLSESGELLSYGASMRRAVSVWIRGFALGVEPIQFFTFFASFFYLKQDGQTPWDAKQSLHISHRPITRRRWVAVFAVAFGMLLMKGAIPLALDAERRDKLKQEIRKEKPAEEPAQKEPFAVHFGEKAHTT